MSENTTNAPQNDLREETAEAAPEVAVQDRVAELENQLAEAKQQYLYAQAENQNVRRRAEKEAADARNYAATALRATSCRSPTISSARCRRSGRSAHRRQVEGAGDRPRCDGREMESVLGRHGITKIEAMGQPLDPNKHQAMIEMPSDQEPGTIVQEMQSGYMIKDRLLRPALVAVAKKPD